MLVFIFPPSPTPPISQPSVFFCCQPCSFLFLKLKKINLLYFPQICNNKSHASIFILLFIFCSCIFLWFLNKIIYYFKHSLFCFAHFGFILLFFLKFLCLFFIFISAFSNTNYSIFTSLFGPLIHGPIFHWTKMKIIMIFLSLYTYILYLF